MKDKYFKRFAWFPTRLWCGRIVWLENYYYKLHSHDAYGHGSLEISRDPMMNITHKDDYQELIKENK